MIKKNPSILNKDTQNDISLSFICDNDRDDFLDAMMADLPVAPIDIHNCSLEAKIKMNLDSHAVEQAAEVKKPERNKPNSKEPTAKSAKVRKGKNVNESNAENEDQEGYDKEYKESQSDDKEAPAPGEVEELTDEE